MYQNEIVPKHYLILQFKHAAFQPDNNPQVNTCTVEPHLSGLFNYPDTCLGTNPHSSTESDSLIRKIELS